MGKSFNLSSLIYKIIILSNLCVCLRTQSLGPVRLFATPWTVACQVLYPRNFPGKNTGVDCHFFLQGIFPNQGSNPHHLWLLHLQTDSLLPSHLGSPSVQFTKEQNRRKNIHELGNMILWIMNALFWNLLLQFGFTCLVYYSFYMQSEFLLLVMVHLRVLHSTCLQYPKNCLFVIMLEKHNRPLLLQSKE